ncbi:MAG: hypothetical protein H0U49_13200 [Parachlamydiaceae bacterium]|nr:hypothetical protein [Parachlamydiaceae bacterium]
MEVDPLLHLKQHVISTSRIKNSDSSIDINFKASFINLKKDYELHIRNFEGRHANVQTEGTHNETLWNSIKKSVKFIKIFFNLSDIINRTHDDFQQLSQIEKEISKLEYYKHNEISILLLNSGLNGLSDNFNLLYHTRESVISLYHINDDLESIAKSNILNYDPEISAIASRALKLKKRVDEELNSIDEDMKRDAKKFERLESLEDVPLDSGLGKDVKGLALLFGMRRELNSLVKDFKKEITKNDGFAKRYHKLKIAIDRMIDHSDINLKRELFSSTLVDFCKKIYYDDGYVDEMESSLKKNLKQISAKKSALNMLFNTNSDFKSKDVINYINFVNNHFKKITHLFTNVYNSGRESLNVVFDNELTINKIFAANELKNLNKSFKESIALSSGIRNYTIIHERSVQPDFQNIFVLPSVAIEKKEYSSNYDKLAPYFQEIDLLVDLCQEQDVNPEKIALAKLKIHSIMEFLLNSLISINSSNLKTEYEEADKTLASVDRKKISQTVLDILIKNRDLKLKNIEDLPKIQSKILMLKDVIIKLNDYLDENFPDLEVVDGKYKKPIVTRFNNMLISGNVASNSPQELQDLSRACEDYLDKLDHLRQSSTSTRGLLKGISVKNPIPNTKHLYLHGHAW